MCIYIYTHSVCARVHIVRCWVKLNIPFPWKFHVELWIFGERQNDGNVPFKWRFQNHICYYYISLLRLFFISFSGGDTIWKDTKFTLYREAFWLQWSDDPTRNWGNTQNPRTENTSFACWLNGFSECVSCQPDQMNRNCSENITTNQKCMVILACGMCACVRSTPKNW